MPCPAHPAANHARLSPAPDLPARNGSLSRRAVLAAALAAPIASVATAAHGQTAPVQPGLAALAAGIRPDLVASTMAAPARHEHDLWSRDAVAIVDFQLPSATPRLFLIDLLAGTVRSMLVAHGKGSDPDHQGVARSFSNVEGSQASSVGAYLTGESYSGDHGPSRRLIGLDPSNSDAEARAIVIHSAWYVGPEILARQGVLGRSDGCFAVAPADIGPLLARLGRGRLLYAG